jgi:hypothetical protein
MLLKRKPARREKLLRFKINNISRHAKTRCLGWKLVAER